MKMEPPGSAMNCSQAEATPASSAQVNTFMASKLQLHRLVPFTLTEGLPAHTQRAFSAHAVNEALGLGCGPGRDLEQISSPGEASHSHHAWGP